MSVDFIYIFIIFYVANQVVAGTRPKNIVLSSLLDLHGQDVWLGLSSSSSTPCSGPSCEGVLEWADGSPFIYEFSWMGDLNIHSLDAAQCFYFSKTTHQVEEGDCNMQKIGVCQSDHLCPGTYVRTYSYASNFWLFVKIIRALCTLSFCCLVPQCAAYRAFHASFDPRITPDHTFMLNPTPPETWDPAVAASGAGVIFHRSTAGVINGVVWICGLNMYNSQPDPIRDCYKAPLGDSAFTKVANALPYASCQGPDTYVEILGKYHYIGGLAVGCKCGRQLYV